MGLCLPPTAAPAEWEFPGLPHGSVGLCREQAPRRFSVRVRTGWGQCPWSSAEWPARRSHIQASVRYWTLTRWNLRNVDWKLMRWSALGLDGGIWASSWSCSGLRLSAGFQRDECSRRMCIMEVWGLQDRGGARMASAATRPAMPSHCIRVRRVSATACHSHS